MTLESDLTAAAVDEIDRAMTLGWKQLAGHTPWGDTFEGFSPDGREVCFERTYLWEHETGGDIRVEVMVFVPRSYESGVKVTRTIPRRPTGEGE